MVPEGRVRDCNDKPTRDDGQFVLYWCVAQHRALSNFGLERAVEHARRLDKPLVVLEALYCDYRWASDRLHCFFLQGVADVRERLSGKAATHYCYIEKKAGGADGLVEELASRACVVVSDDWPSFFIPQLVQGVADAAGVKVEAVDSCGLYPFRAVPRVYKRAVDFRRHLQKELGSHLSQEPGVDPLRGVELPRYELPTTLTRRWPDTDPAKFLEGGGVGRLPIDHDVPVVEGVTGGSTAAKGVLRRFLDDRLARYGERRNAPQEDAASELSFWLHFGHISIHEVLRALASKEGWEPDDAGGPAKGAKEGWWGMSPEAESFLDEIVTWRELGIQFCAQVEDHDAYDSLPGWARDTLEQHAADERPYLYSLEEFEEARTHDELWNAAQVQLRTEGRIHNYLRMLWGKKILHWTREPQEALEIMFELNNKYALDGRDPNSTSGITWCFGRFDRAWGPEREIFGKVRYMTSKSTRSKYKVDGYIEEYSTDRIR